MSDARWDDERALIAACRTGDLDAFGAFLDRYQRRVFGLIYGLTRNRADTEDLVQQTFLKAYRNVARLDSSRSAIGWLSAVAYRLTMDHFRRRRLESTALMQHQQTTQRADSTTPHNVASEKELGSILRRAVDELPEAQRRTFVLSRVEGLSHSDIARMTGSTVEAVRANLYQSLKKLRNVLDGLQ